MHLTFTNKPEVIIYVCHWAYICLHIYQNFISPKILCANMLPNIRTYLSFFVTYSVFSLKFAISHPKACIKKKKEATCTVYDYNQVKKWNLTDCCYKKNMTFQRMIYNCFNWAFKLPQLYSNHTNENLYNIFTFVLFDIIDDACVNIISFILMQENEKWIWKIGYCKSGNIRGTLTFANFAQNSASVNSKTREKYLRYFVCTFWTRRSCVSTMCVDANG